MYVCTYIPVRCKPLISSTITSHREGPRSPSRRQMSSHHARFNPIRLLHLSIFHQKVAQQTPARFSLHVPYATVLRLCTRPRQKAALSHMLKHRGQVTAIRRQSLKQPEPPAFASSRGPKSFCPQRSALAPWILVAYPHLWGAMTSLSSSIEICTSPSSFTRPSK